jgi:LytS/YehU family sensor histidine kinase
LATVAVIGSAIGAPVWLLAHRVAAEIASGGEVVFLEWVYVPRILADHFATLLIWSGAYLAASHWRDARDREQKAVEGTALAHQAQLELLRYQLNPHFLFNALASIRALVLTDPATAHRMITEFSELLRASLRRPTSARVALADEVAMARRYLEIETMRFGDALDTTIVIPREADAALVPEFILQPLVENAIKHGKPAPNRVLTVSVSAAVTGSSLALEVANTGSLAPARSGRAPSTADGDRRGIGLQMVRARLEAEYPGTHGFDLEQDGAFVRARVRLPLMRA